MDYTVSILSVKDLCFIDLTIQRNIYYFFSFFFLFIFVDKSIINLAKNSILFDFLSTFNKIFY
jgi:hypothetical protein